MTAGEKSAEGTVVRRRRTKARTVPREGMKEREVTGVKNPGSASVERTPLPARVRDETGVRARRDGLPVNSERLMNVRHVDSLYRTAVYVTRTYGGVGGGVP